MKTRRMIPADSTWTKPAPDYYTRMIDYRCSSPDSVYSRVEHEKLVHSIPQGNKVDWGHEWALIRILSEKHDPSSPMLSFLWVSREGVLDSNRVIGYNVISISRSSDMSLNLRGCKFGASALRKCREIVLDDARQRGYQSYILSALVNPNDLSAMSLFKQRGFRDYDSARGLGVYHRLAILLWVEREQRHETLLSLLPKSSV